MTKNTQNRGGGIANLSMYATPELSLHEVVVEHGFAHSIEVVEKDEEVEF